MFSLALATVLLFADTNDTYTSSMQSIAARDLSVMPQKFKFKFKFKIKKSKTADRAEVSDPALTEIRYEFGSRTFVGLTKKSVAALKHGKNPLSNNCKIMWGSRGCLPDTELIVAQIQYQLDVCRSGDRFMGFLNSWRNGDESFYEALDRTAGTENELFYYDAMLGDFVGQFAKDDGKKWDLGTRQNNISQGFLTYRQYRAFIETISWSLVLPPDTPLPAQLSRYDYSSVTRPSLSTRHVIDLYLDHNKGDVAATVAVFAKLLANKPLPDPLWTSNYTPVSYLFERFQADMNVMVQASGVHTDSMLQRINDSRRRLAASLKETN